MGVAADEKAVDPSFPEPSTPQSALEANEVAISEEAEELTEEVEEEAAAPVVEDLNAPLMLMDSTQMEGSVRDLNQQIGAASSQPYVAPEAVNEITTGASLYTTAAVLAGTASWGGLMSFIATAATVFLALVVMEATTMGEPLVAMSLTSTAVTFAIISITQGSAVLEAAPLFTIALTALFALIALLGTVTTVLAAGIAILTAIGLVVHVLYSLGIAPVVKAVDMANTHLPTVLTSTPNSLVTQLRAQLQSLCGSQVRDGITLISTVFLKMMGRPLSGSGGGSSGGTFGGGGATSGGTNVEYNPPSDGPEGAAATDAGRSLNPYAGDDADDEKWEKEVLIDFGAGDDKSTVSMDAAIASTAAAKMEWVGVQGGGAADAAEQERQGQQRAQSGYGQIGGGQNGGGQSGYGHDTEGNPWGETLEASYTGIASVAASGSSSGHAAPSSVLVHGAVPTHIPLPQQPPPPPPQSSALSATPALEFGESLLHQQYEKEQQQKQSPHVPPSKQQQPQPAPQQQQQQHQHQQQQQQQQQHQPSSLDTDPNAEDDTPNPFAASDTPNPFAGDEDDSDDDDAVFGAVDAPKFESDED
jgi:hypothetical protein